MSERGSVESTLVAERERRSGRAPAVERPTPGGFQGSVRRSVEALRGLPAEALLHLGVASIARAATLFVLSLGAALAVLGHTERTESLLFALGVAALPLVGIGVSAAQVAALPPLGRARAVSDLALVAVLAAAVAVAGARLVSLADAPRAAWLLVAGAALLVEALGWRALGGEQIRTGGAAAPGRPRLDPLIAALAAVPLLVLLFATDAALAPAAVGVFAAATVLATPPLDGLARRVSGVLGRRRRAAIVALDVAAVLGLALLVADLEPHLTGDPGAALKFHQSFWLGPVNDVLNGRPMLVDTFSQYGVGVFYFLAGAFETVVPLGWGGMSLLLSVLMVVQFVALYAVLRLATGSLAISIVTVAVAVAASLLESPFFYTEVPSTGPLRFGIPVLLVLAAVAAERFPERRSWLRGAGLLLVAVSAIWSFEAFVYTAFTAAALAAFSAWAAEGSPVARARRFVRDVAALAVVSLGAHLLFALATRAFAGEWPDWGVYLDFIRLYSTGGFGAEPFRDWSPAVLVGGLLGASFAVLVLLAASGRARSRFREDGALLTALVGFTAFGIASFTYFLGRSVEANITFVAAPPVVLAGLWLAAATRSGALPRQGRVAVVALAAWLAVLLVGEALPDLSDKWRSTGLRAALHSVTNAEPEGTLRSRLRQLTDNPVSDARTVSVEASLARYVPGDGPAVVLLTNELSVEALMRARRSNALPITNPGQSELLPSSFDDVTGAVARLRPGTHIVTEKLVDDTSRSEQYGARPDSVWGFPWGLPLVSDALRAARAEFELDLVSSTPDQIMVYRLERRRRPLRPGDSR